MISGAMQTSEDRQYSISAMYSMLPWDSPYDAEGKLVPHQYSEWVNSNSTNYLRDLQWNHYDGSYYEFMGNLDFDVRIAPWLTFSSVNNYKYVHSTGHGYEDPRSNGGESVQGRITEYHGQVARRYSNQKLLTNNSWGLHTLNGLLAYEFNDYWGKSTSANGTGFVPGFEVLDITAKPEKAKEYADKVLGADPQSRLRQWESIFANINAENVNAKALAYSSLAEPANLLVVSLKSNYPSLTTSGEYFTATRYAHQNRTADEETLWAINLFPDPKRHSTTKE